MFFMQPYQASSLFKAQPKNNCVSVATVSALPNSQYNKTTKYRYQVAVIERVLPHYRIPFIRHLRHELLKRSIDLTFIYGQQLPGKVPAMVPLNEPWAHQITNKYFAIANNQLVWQPCLHILRNMDLVIVEQANKLLINYLLHIRRIFSTQKIAFFGHGKNFQAKEHDGWKEWIKSKFINQVDWWFAYTKMTSDIVLKSGFPCNRLTIVQNAIDTNTLAAQIAQQSPHETKTIKKELGITSDNIAIYCGGMYPDKNLDFLLSACYRIRHRIPDFNILFIGNGPLQYKIISAANEHNWIHYIGPKFDASRVPYLMMSKAMLIPGGVGLAILDCFTARIPLFTIDINIHGPEIAYLDNEVNGIVSKPTVEEYANSVINYFLSPDLQCTLIKGCNESAKNYSIETMVNNFSNGIELCLKT